MKSSSLQNVAGDGKAKLILTINFKRVCATEYMH